MAKHEAPVWNTWNYRESAGVPAGFDLTGFDVQAVDGHIGTIDEATYDLGSSYVVVDTGPWIFGSKVVLPAGTIERVDHSDRRVYVARTKLEIKNAPEFDKERYATVEYRNRLADYYGRFRY